MFGKFSSFEPGRFSPFRVILFFILCTALVVQAGVPCLAGTNDDKLTKVGIFGPDNIASMIAGTGMVPSGSGVFTAEVPGEIIAGYFYILSHDLIKNGIQFPKGDEDVQLDITSGVGFNQFFTIPVKYKAKMRRGHKAFVNVMEVTSYIDQGLNTFDVSGMDVDQANGAGVIIIYRDPGASYKTIKVIEGCDFAFYTNDPPTGPDTEAYIFRFAPTGQDRQATFKTLVGDALDFRGDEVFAFTRPGKPADYLKDRDGDGRKDITRRDRRLGKKDFLPLGNDPANRTGKKEAQRWAISLEEDLLGVPVASGGYSYGTQLDIFQADVTIPAGNKYIAFQFQSEDPEDGDSFQVAAALLEVEAAYATVGDFVWNDANEDGLQNEGPSSGIADVTVDIACDTDGDMVEDYFDSTVTDADGLYLFTLDPIADGNCRVTVDLGSPVLFGLNPTTPTETNTGTLDEYEEDLDNDFGFAVAPVPGETDVGDFVWLDYNCDGIQDDGEPGIENISVRTIAGPPSQDETQVTDAEGLYLQSIIIDNCLDPGTLPTAAISVDTNDPDLPAGAVFSTPTTYNIGPLQCGVPNLDNDFGVCIPGEIEIVKTASGETFYPGETVTYTYTVTNTGDVDLTDVVVTDNRIPDLGSAANIGDLAVGQMVSFDYTITVPECGTSEDGFSDEKCEGATYLWEAGCYLRNRADVTGTDPTGGPVSDWDIACIGILDPDIEIIKTVSPDYGYPGDTVVYTYTVTNTGDVDLTDVVVTDNRIPDLGSAANIGDLAVGQMVSFDYTITVPECGLPEDGFSQEPCEDSSYDGEASCYLRNTADVVGTDPKGNDVTDSDDACITILPPVCLPNIYFDVDSSGSPLAAGDIVDNQPVWDGVNVTTNDPAHLAMIFDSASPTGGDADLGTPNQDFSGPGIGAGGRAGEPGENILPQGKVLIISADNDPSDPNDYSGGGTMTFTFDSPVIVTSLGILDIEEAGGLVTAFDSLDQVIVSLPMAQLGDNSYQKLILNAMEVARLEITFGGSGALASVNFCADIEVTKTASPTFGEAPLPVAFTFDVTNTGFEDLEEVLVVDSVFGQIAPLFYLPVGATETFTINATLTEDCEIGGIDPLCIPPEPPECCKHYNVVTGTGYGVETGSEVTDMDWAVVEVCPPCGPCDGKVTMLRLRYIGTEPAEVKVKQKNPYVTVFPWTLLQPGDEFEIFGVDDRGTLSTEIYIFVNGDFHVTIHTSCSEAIGPGLIRGDFEVVFGTSRNGGILCPLD